MIYMSAFQVPVIETDRLRLRGHQLEDFEFFRDMWADPAVTRYIGGKPRSEEETWTKFLRSIGHWPVMGFGYWAVEEKGGPLIGEVGFGEFKRAMKPLIRGEPEMGWVLCTSAHGRGFATEAALAAIDWGDRHFSGKRMSCIIEHRNSASIRVAEKCGFRYTTGGEYDGEELVLMHRG